MSKSIVRFAAVSAAVLGIFAQCSKNSGPEPIGQFPAQLSQFPVGITPTNIEQEVAGSDAVLPQGILARKSAWLRHHTQINTNVFVLGNCTGHGCLDPAAAPANPKHINNADSELTVGVYVSVPAGRILKADKIRLKNRANVQGTTEANTYAQATSAVIANKLSPLTTLPRLPFFLKGTPGQANINVTGQELTLATGQYANITVRQAKKLVLQGGFYQVHDIDLKREASLECQSQCYLTVKADIIADKKVILKASSGNPNDFLIYVEGGDAAAQPMAASAKAVQLAGLAHVTANIYAPNGRLMFGAGTIAQGAFIGNHVRVDPNSIVTQGPQPTGIARFIEASVGGTVEVPGKVKLEVPANALDEDTVISVQEKGPIPATAPRSPAQLRFVGEAFEFQPDGLTFTQNYTLTMYYDPAQVAAIGVTPNDIRIFSAPSESVLYAPSSSAKVVGTNQLQTEENHFTIFVIGSGGVGDSVSGLKLIGDRLIVSDLRGGDGPRYRISRYNIANKATVPQFENYSRWTALGNILANDQHVFTLERGYLPSGSPLASPVRLDTGMVNANCSSAPLSLHNQFYDFERGWIYEHLGITRLALWGTIVSGISQIQGSSPNNCNLNLTSPNDAFMPDYRAHDIMVSGNTFYSASGIYPFSVQVRANSFSGGVLGGFSGGFVYAMRPKGNFAIFGTQAIGVPGVVAFDPGTQGIYRHSTGRSFETIYDLVVTGNVVYALGVSGSGQITEMDMTDPTTPQPPMSSIAVAPDSFHMAQSGNYLVVAEGAFSSPNLRLINIGFPVRGTVTGLVSGTLELVNTVTTGTPPKTVISANGAYQNAELIADGNAYNFVVATQPPGNNCTVSNGSGVMDFHSAPVVVDVNCVTVAAWRAADHLHFARYGHTATRLLDGRVLVAGGISTNTNFLPSAEIFDPAGNAGFGSFALTANMSAARFYHTATLLNDGRVLLVGGLRSFQIGGYLSTAELFDPSGNAGAGSFTSIQTNSLNRYEHTATLMSDGRVLIVGGYNQSGAEVEVFDPAGNSGLGSFTLLGAYPESNVLAHGATLLNNGKVLITDGAFLTGTAQVFDPTINGGIGAFIATGRMVTERARHSAFRLMDGRVIIFGGQDRRGGIPMFSEFFDLNSNGGIGAFGSGPPMVSRSLKHAAIQMPDGRVLISGGIYGQPLSRTEIFDPAGNAGAGIFSPTASMSVSRVEHTATLLLNGSILVVGGYQDSGMALINASAEIYQ